MRRFRSPCILLSNLVAALALSQATPLYAAAPGLREAVESAWARQPASRALPARQEELAAKRSAASALFPKPPSVTLAQRTDRFDRNDGDNETEAEVSLPLWMPGTRDNARRLAAAESGRLDVDQRAAKLKLAGEVREAYWQARLAQNEHTLVEHEAHEAAVLAQDVQRRVQAGDLARADLNRAQSAERLASITAAEAQARAFRALKLFATLTGLAQLPEASEQAADSGQPADDHPQLAASGAAVAVSQARLAQAGADRRDPPELSFGVRRERPTARDAYDNSLRVAIRIPLATDSRNGPRIAAANAELIEAETALALDRERVQAGIDAARTEFEQARRIETLAGQRARLATDTRDLYAKAFRLGERDLPTLLLVENEHFDAELALSRARLEAGRAASRLNQALGLLP